MKQNNGVSMKELNDLTDLEIRKEIAEIEGKKVHEDNSQLTGFALLDSESYECFNPLTDKALCFDLMVKYGVNISFIRPKEVSICGGQLFYFRDDLQRAICLVIIAQQRSKGGAE